MGQLGIKPAAVVEMGSMRTVDRRMPVKFKPAAAWVVVIVL
jgi:hypothetical protein